ncbi:MAG: hypothetical protein R3D98_15985 [Candidatus Krumholzibacteriia bacterium]
MEYFPDELQGSTPVDFGFRIGAKQYLYKVIDKRSVWKKMKDYERLRRSHILNYLFTPNTYLNDEGEVKLKRMHHSCFSHMGRVYEAKEYVYGEPLQVGFVHLVDTENRAIRKLKTVKGLNPGGRWPQDRVVCSPDSGRKD